MAVRLQANQIQNLQQIEAVVSSSEGAMRLVTVTGQTSNIGFSAFSQGPFTQASQTFTVLIGPTLTRQQFVRAILHRIRCANISKRSSRSRPIRLWNYQQRCRLG